MADPTTLPEEQVSAPLVYRRLSGFAVASLAVAVTFVVSILIAAAWSLRERSPLQVPVLFQAVPVIGAVLALVALYLIRRGEGTLAGRGLAVWGWWLSVLSGLTYWAYLGATYTAVNQQAERFVLSWFDNLKADELGAAFLDTQDPSSRAKINPKDAKQINDKYWLSAQGGGPPKDGIARQPLDLFRNNDIVRLVEQGGSSTQVKPLGVREWDFKGGGYRVKRVYQLTNDQGIHQLIITVVGLESKTNEFKGRQWNVVMGSDTAILHSAINAEGEKAEELRNRSRKFLDAWSGKLARGYLGAAYADTLDPSRRARMEAEDDLQLMLGSLGAAVPVPGLLGPPLGGCLPAATFKLALDLRRPRLHQALTGSGLLHTDKLEADSNETRARVLAGLEAMFGGPRPGPQFMGFNIKVDKSAKHWRYEDNRLRITHEGQLRFMAFTGPTGGPMVYPVDATVTVESDPGPLDPSRTFHWRVVSVDVAKAGQLDPMAEQSGQQQKMPPGMREKMQGGPPGNGGPPGRPQGP